MTIAKLLYKTSCFWYFFERDPVISHNRAFLLLHWPTPISSVVNALLVSGALLGLIGWLTCCESHFFSLLPPVWSSVLRELNKLASVWPPIPFPSNCYCLLCRLPLESLWQSHHQLHALLCTYPVWPFEIVIQSTESNSTWLSINPCPGSLLSLCFHIRHQNTGLQNWFFIYPFINCFSFFWKQFKSWLHESYS